MLPTIIDGMKNYSGGVCLDGWSYVVAGQSLQNHPLGAEGGLPLGVQYAAQFGNTRFISYAFLALLAPLAGRHNDTQDALGPYLGLLFFTFASACLFFGRTARLQRYLAWILVLLTLISGWTLKLLNANSVDNTFAISFLPAVIGVLLLTTVPSIRNGITLGVIVAGGLYAYPEASPFVAWGILTVGIERAVSMRDQLRETARMIGAVVVTIIVCVLPYARQVGLFFQQQLHAASTSTGPRPGEGFYELLHSPRYALPDFWGLTPDFYLQTYSGRYDTSAAVIAGVLTLAACAGMFFLVRNRSWGLPLFVLGMTAGYLVALVHFHYSYAAFKILTIAWFALCYLLLASAKWIWQQAGSLSFRPIAYVTLGTGATLLIAIAGLFVLQSYVFYRALPFKSVKEFRKISALDGMAHGQPVAVLVDDTYANLWAVHFLRDTKLYLADQYRGYMAKQRLLDRAESVQPSTIRFVVTDNQYSFSRDRLLQVDGPYFVWDQRQQPWVLPLTPINHIAGTQEDDLPPHGWEDRSWIELRLVSRTARETGADVDLVAGNGMSYDTPYHIQLVDGVSEEQRSIRSGMHSFNVHLKPGLNKIFIGSAEKTVSSLTVTNVAVRPSSSVQEPEIRDVEDPNGVETWEADPFFWVGGRATTLMIVAARSGLVELSTILVAGPSLADRASAHLEIGSAGGTKSAKSLAWGAEKLQIPIQAGMNKIVLQAVGQSLPTQGDSRTMMVGFRNLRLSYVKVSANALH